MPAQADDQDWTSVIGRSLAFLCLHYAEMRTKTLMEQAEFLARLGVSRREAAVILGSTEESLSVMARRAKTAGKRTPTEKRAGAKKGAAARSTATARRSRGA